MRIRPARLPATLFGLQGVIFTGIGIRETVTGSCVGGVLAWGLAALAFLTTFSASRR